jgi:hypothetical protein
MLPPSHDLGDPDPPGLEGWAEDCLARAEAPDADVAEVNRRFVFVEEPESGEAYVLLRNPEPIGRHGLPPIYCRLNVTAFQSHFLNNRVMVPGPRGMVERTLAEKWLGDPHRATVTRVVCDPSPEGPRDPGVFNLWRGFRTTPGESGDAALWPTISRLLDAMTRDEPVVRRYVEGWCAHLFQRPERLPLVSIVIRSTQQGVGKSSFAQLLALMVGRHAHIITNPQADLLGTFNAGLEHKVLIDIEELNGREARAAADHLKNLITSPRLQINQKNEAVRTIDNYARVIITSNDEIVAPSGIDARRFLYLTMDARFKTRPGWQNDLIAFNNATINDDNPDHPELRAFRRYLMDLDISGWAPHNLPDTDDRRSHIEAEIEHDITMSWWVACLENGVVCGVPWPKQVIFLALEVDYNRFCDTQHRHPLGRNRFRSNLRTWIFGRDRRGWPSDRERIVVSKVEMSPVIRAQASAMRDMASAEAGFKLPSRERCAEAFYEATGYRVELAPAPIDLATPRPALPADGGNPSPADRGDPTDGLEFAPF